jgi:hypothetical protein
MNKFFNTMLGSWVKVFITVVLAQYMAMGISIFDLDIESIKCLLSSGVASLIPVIINYLNPNDPRYGPKK